jgi:anti-sigma-K factor RskA
MTMREAFHIAEEDLIQYALGTLKEGQLSQYTAHISLCNVCRGDLARIQVELAAFAAVQEMSEPPAGAKERFLHRLTNDKMQESKLLQKRNKSRLYYLTKSFQHWIESPVPMRVLSGALAAALIFVTYDDLSHLHQIRQLQPELKRFEIQSAEFAELKEFLHGTDAQQVSLHEKAPLVKAPEGHTLYSAASGKLVFTATNMPPPPPGKAYELWLLPAAGGPPVPAGVFTPDIQGSAAVVFPDIPVNVQAAGFGVTVEDAAGSKTPTSPIILSGQ